MDSETISLPQAAVFLGISPPTLRKLAVKKRLITCIKYGTRIKFRVADLETFKKRNTLDAKDTDAAENF